MGCGTSKDLRDIGIKNIDGIYYIHRNGTYCASYTDIDDALVALAYARRHRTSDWKPLQ